MQKSVTFETTNYPDRIEKIYRVVNDENIVDKAFSRLIKMFKFESSGGYNGLDRGWVRLEKKHLKKTLYFQVNWNLDNDGNYKASMSFTKFLK